MNMCKYFSKKSKMVFCFSILMLFCFSGLGFVNVAKAQDVKTDFAPAINSSINGQVADVDVQTNTIVLDGGVTIDVSHATLQISYSEFDKSNSLSNVSKGDLVYVDFLAIPRQTGEIINATNVFVSRQFLTFFGPIQAIDLDSNSLGFSIANQKVSVTNETLISGGIKFSSLEAGMLVNVVTKLEGTKLVVVEVSPIESLADVDELAAAKEVKKPKAKFDGKIELLPTDKKFIGDWKVAGKIVHVKKGTKVLNKKKLAMGIEVQVKGKEEADKSITANEIKLKPAPKK